MLSFQQFSASSLWVYCAQTCGLPVFHGLFIHDTGSAVTTGVHRKYSFTTSTAHFLYSISPSPKQVFTSVTWSLFHTIHRTYNYTQFREKNIFIIRQWINQEVR